MRLARTLPLLLAGASIHAADWSLESLFTRPYAWGTSPSRPTWAKDKPVLVFLWNEEGRRFLDLYAWHAREKRRVRLTSLEFAKDPFNPPPDDSDERLKQHRMPDAGIASFHLSNDGSKVAFPWRGDIYIVDTMAAKQPFRLTQTKAAESNP